MASGDVCRQGGTASVHTPCRGVAETQFRSNPHPLSLIPKIDRYKLRDTKRIPVSCQGQLDPPPHSRRGQPEAVLSPTPVILAAAGIQSPDHAPRRLCRLGRAEGTGRRPTWTIPADPRQVGWERGLWIPAAARMTGDLGWERGLWIPAAARMTGDLGWERGLWIPAAARMTGDH